MGKSTTALNLGAGLAEQGYPTLLVDLDPHAGLTKMLRENPEHVAQSFSDVFFGKAEQLIKPAGLPGLFLIPANDQLAIAEAELRSHDPNWGSALRDALEPLRTQYDYIVIDTPPSLGVLATTAIGAADGVIVPLQSDFIATSPRQSLMTR